MSAQGTQFVITSWNEEPPQWSPDTMRYLVYKRELGETTQGLHWQGYVQMYNKCREKACEKELGITRGQVKYQKAKECATARAYVFKLDTAAGTPIEFGTFQESIQGKRTDIDQFVTAAADITNTKRQMYTDHSSCMVKYGKAYEDIRATYTEPRNWKTFVTVIIGPTGSGKTRSVHEKYGVNGYFPMRISNKGWWSGYDAHDIVLIDDFKGWLLPAEMLDLLDRYPVTVNTKGSRAQFVPKRIYITSCVEPKYWWGPDVLGDRIAELMRRIDHIEYTGTPVKTHFPNCQCEQCKLQSPLTP